MIHTHCLSARLAFSLLGLSLALAGASRAAELAPAARPAANPAAAAADTLQVMTINLEHHDNPAEMRAMAANLKSMKKVPDFILCQEVYFERRGDKADPEENTAAVFAKYLGYYCKGTKRTSDREGIAIISKYPFDRYDS